MIQLSLFWYFPFYTNDGQSLSNIVRPISSLHFPIGKTVNEFLKLKKEKQKEKKNDNTDTNFHIRIESTHKNVTFQTTNDRHCNIYTHFICLYLYVRTKWYKLARTHFQRSNLNQKKTGKRNMKKKWKRRRRNKKKIKE